MSSDTWAIYDLRSLRDSLVAQSVTLDELARDVRASNVTDADIGGAEADGVEICYQTVVHGALVDSLAAFQVANRQLARHLDDAVERYVQLDQEGA